MNIPAQLKDCRFFPIKSIKIVDGKKVFEGGLPKAWQTENLDYASMQAHLTKHGGAYGVVAGNEHAIIDVDLKGTLASTLNERLKLLPPTFQVRSISGGTHSYYACTGATGRRFQKESGELRSGAMFVIGPNCVVVGKKYEVISSLPVAAVSKEQIESVLGKFFAGTETEAVQTEPKETDQSRSGREFAEVCKLIKIGMSKDEIFKKMEAFAKWVSAPKQYKELTFEKAWAKVEEENQKKPTHTKPEFLSYRDFEKMKENKNYLVKDIIDQNTITMLYSLPKTYKSTLAVYLGLMLANGKDFLGKKTRRSSVLIIDLENPAATIKSRLAGIRKGSKIRSKNFPLFYVLGGDVLGDTNFIPEIKKFTKEKKVRLVIIDTLRRCGDFEENSSDAINRIYREIFAPLVRECGCAVLFLHHSGKNELYRGSSDLLGLIDSSFALKRTPKSSRFTLVCEASRNFAEVEDLHGEALFSEDGKSIIFNAVSAGDNANKERETFNALVQEIKKLFGKIGDELQKADIMQGLKKADIQYSDGYLKDALRWMCEKGLLDKPQKGKYRRLFPEYGPLDGDSN